MSLSRSAISEEIRKVAAKTAAVQETRPPFGILATPKARSEYGQALQNTSEEREALQKQLSKVEALELWIRSKLRPKIEDYIQRESPGFRRSKDVYQALDQYVMHINGCLDFVKAFARELHNLIKSAAASTSRTSNAYVFDDLRQVAANLDCQFLELEIDNQRVVRAGENSIYSKIRIAPPSFDAQAIFVERLMCMSNAEIVTLAQQVEGSMRDFLSTGAAALTAQIETAREQVRCIEKEYIDNYWNQLREYAQIHYVVERDLDEVLLELSRRRLEDRQTEVVTRDPFVNAR